jgi:hypothetical protein
MSSFAPERLRPRPRPLPHSGIRAAMARCAARRGERKGPDMMRFLLSVARFCERQAEKNGRFSLLWSRCDHACGMRAERIGRGI